MKKAVTILLLGLSLITGINSCKKESNNNPPAKTATLEKSSYYQLEVAIVNTEGITFTRDTFSGNLNGANVTIVRVQNKLAFSVPEIPAGSYTVNTNIEGNAYSFNLAVVQLPAITNAQTTIDAIITPASFDNTEMDSLGAFAQHLNADPNWAQNRTILTDYYNTFTSQYNALSSTEKIELAKFLKANESLFTALPDLNTYIDSTNVSYKTDDLDVALRLSSAATQLTASRTQLSQITAVAAVAIVACYTFPNVVTCAGAAGATLVLAGKLYHHARVVNAILDKTFEPVEAYLEGAAARSVIPFTKNQLYGLALGIKLRTLYNADVNNPANSIKKMETEFDECKLVYNIGNGKLPSPLNTPIAHPTDKTNYQTRQYRMGGQEYGIENLSNSQVTLVSKTLVGNELQVKFTTSATTDQPFTFDVVYKDAEFNVRQTVSANLVVPSTAITDYDGNVYDTVRIGNQTWLKHNLTTSHYQNGDPIATNLSQADWANTTSGAYSIYLDDQLNNDIYGKLYNWYAATDPRKVCPVGWHVPSNAEFTVLANYVGGVAIAGLKLKATSTWATPGATDSYGFQALAAGNRYAFNTSNTYEHMTQIAEFVTTDDAQYTGYGSSYAAWGGNVGIADPSYNPGASDSIFISIYLKAYGGSIRCLKD